MIVQGFGFKGKRVDAFSLEIVIFIRQVSTYNSFIFEKITSTRTVEWRLPPQMALSPLIMDIFLLVDERF